ncbi:MAG: hypothetical protein LBC20_03645 [Planctomycetaceae bacterium]|jgi:hypothetical protein|nr:hypothetical protein [Planctomycetaceae bacterium]
MNCINKSRLFVGHFMFWIFVWLLLFSGVVSAETKTPFTVEILKPETEFSALKYEGNNQWYDSVYWTGHGWARIGKNWQHPENTHDTVRTFCVPKEGTVRVTGNVKKLHLDGDGVVVSILHNNKELWKKTIEGKESIGFDTDILLEVKKGEKLRFVVNKRGSISCDTTGWTPVITYQESGETFDAATAFSDTQGNGGWFYEMSNVNSVPVKPVITLNLNENDYRQLTEGLPHVPDFAMFPLVLSEWVLDDWQPLQLQPQSQQITKQQNRFDIPRDRILTAIRDHQQRILAILSRQMSMSDSEHEKMFQLFSALCKQVENTIISETELQLLYLKTRLTKRSLMFADPRTHFGELLFVKNRPTAYTHLVGQYFGWNQRPGGGIFVLEQPGMSLKHRDLIHGQLPPGHVLEPRLSYDAKRIAFSHVAVPEKRIAWQSLNVNEKGNNEYYYHLYEMGIDGENLRQLTNNKYDDMMPEYLPDGALVFVSTRRQAYSRCFGPQFGERWHSYTLFRTGIDTQGFPDTKTITQISFNDVSEWFPAMSPSGLLLFARWDYIDRDAVTHQNLWSMRPDGTNPAAIWGNAAPKPHCMFQAKPIGDTNKIVFIASAHHSITAGPICIVDPSVDANSLDAVTRITPEAFPEAESMNIPEYYNSPYPLGEDLFLAAYSRDKLIFEPRPNPDNALGLYLLDDRGNREVLYRDTKIGSTCPLPVMPRIMPQLIVSYKNETLATQRLGEMSIMNVYEGLDGNIKSGSLKELRIVQIFPKTSAVVNLPRIGVAGEENTRAVLGTVPIEADGSVRFLVPAGKPLLFQVLDENGFAYQTMRSTTSVMPGEQTSCVGCHENRVSAAPLQKNLSIALTKPAPRIRETPESGRPYGFVEMVQPILDAKCVSCHNNQKTEGGYNLSRTLDKNGYTVSYFSLCRDPKMIPRYAERNQIQQSESGGKIGAIGSGLIQLLQKKHADVELTPEELRRIGTWIDLNAVFYGTYDLSVLPLQQRGEPIPMPKFE